MLSASDIKYYSSLKHKKYREEYRKFLIEGFHLVEECLASDYELECVIVRNDIDLKADNDLFGLLKSKNIPLHTLKPSQFSKLPETMNSQGIVGVVKQKTKKNTADLNLLKLIIALDRINDPGNLGTIIRTAHWFGAEGILLSRSSVDVFNSKVIRASQGALFHVNLYSEIDLASNLRLLDEKGFSIFLLSPSGGSLLHELRRDEKSVFVFGNESKGISSDLTEEKYRLLTIPGYSNCESLNVAVSCGIVLYHFKTTAS